MASVGLDHAVVEVAGVGIAVQATPSTLATLRRGEQAQLHTTLVVREDSLTLFGFADVEARDMFTQLQSVSGIGPRLALATLAVLEPEALRTAITQGQITTLTQVPGIGKKGAERLTLELRDKMVESAAGTLDGAQPEQSTAVRSEVVEALVGLGFATRQAEQSVDKVLASAEPPADTSGALRAALTALGSKR